MIFSYIFYTFRRNAGVYRKDAVSGFFLSDFTTTSYYIMLL